MAGNGSFAYDGDGRRVKRTWTPNGGSTTTTYYYYDAAGRLATEYSTAAPQVVHSVYPFTDLLGSVRAVAGEPEMQVQAATGGGGVRAFTNNVTAGNLLIVATTWYHGCAAATIADTRGTVYTPIQQDFYDATHLAVFYGFAPSQWCKHGHGDLRVGDPLENGRSRIYRNRCLRHVGQSQL
jgi:hypothetical protein